MKPGGFEPTGHNWIQPVQPRRGVHRARLDLVQAGQRAAPLVLGAVVGGDADARPRAAEDGGRDALHLVRRQVLRGDGPDGAEAARVHPAAVAPRVEAHARERDADAAARRELRREQDVAYRAALASDAAAAAADAAAAEEVAAAAEAAAAVERAFQDAAEERTKAALEWSTRPEPAPGTEGAVHLAFSYPDGARVRRRFPADTTLREALHFALASASFASIPVDAAAVGRCTLTPPDP